MGLVISTLAYLKIGSIQMEDWDKLQNEMSHHTFDAVKLIQNKAAHVCPWHSLTLSHLTPPPPHILKSIL